MPLTHSYVSISEQMKNVRFLLSVSEQPLVATTIDQLAEERRRGLSAGSAFNQIHGEMQGAVARTGLKKAAERVLPSLSADFTIADLSSRMAETGYKFRAKNIRDALGHLVKRLSKEGRIKLVKRGAGVNPSIYRVLLAAK